jgi:hypothetical protein
MTSDLGILLRIDSEYPNEQNKREIMPKYVKFKKWTLDPHKFLEGANIWPV